PPPTRQATANTRIDHHLEVDQLARRACSGGTKCRSIGRLRRRCRCSPKGTPRHGGLSEPMSHYQSSQHHFVEAVRWRPEQDAERVNDNILLSRGTTSSYLATTDAGDVVIN